MSPHFEPTTETWSWGDLFDVEVPIDCATRDLGDAVEIGARTLNGRAHLAALSDDGGGSPELAARRVLERFAATRGVGEGLRITILEAPDGVTQARASLSDGSGHWRVGAAAWPGHVVLCTGWAPEGDAGIFALVDHLLASLRRHARPGAVALEPDPPGEF